MSRIIMIKDNVLLRKVICLLMADSQGLRQDVIEVMNTAVIVVLKAKLKVQ